MNYKDAIKQSMEMLAQDERTRFLGYNVAYGSKAYETLKDISRDKILETPLAENLMTDLAIGMSLEGFRPVIFYERHDFILNALDALVNHLDKIEKMSQGQYKTPLILRATVGGTKPFHPGVQHIQNFTEVFQKLFTFPVIDLRNPKQILEEYKKAKSLDSSIMFVEHRDLYETE